MLVTDAEEVRTYYRVRHDSDSIMIPYGADLLPRSMPLPANLGVEPDAVVCIASRSIADDLGIYLRTAFER